MELNWTGPKDDYDASTNYSKTYITKLMSRLILLQFFLFCIQSNGLQLLEKMMEHLV